MGLVRRWWIWSPGNGSQSLMGQSWWKQTSTPCPEAHYMGTDLNSLPRGSLRVPLQDGILVTHNGTWFTNTVSLTVFFSLPLFSSPYQCASWDHLSSKLTATCYLDPCFGVCFWVFPTKIIKETKIAQNDDVETYLRWKHQAQIKKPWGNPCLTWYLAWSFYLCLVSVQKAEISLSTEHIICLIKQWISS